MLNCISEIFYLPKRLAGVNTKTIELSFSSLLLLAHSTIHHKGHFQNERTSLVISSTGLVFELAFWHCLDQWRWYPDYWTAYQYIYKRMTAWRVHLCIGRHSTVHDWTKLRANTDLINNPHPGNVHFITLLQTLQLYCLDLLWYWKCYFNLNVLFWNLNTLGPILQPTSLYRLNTNSLRLGHKPWFEQMAGFRCPLWEWGITSVLSFRDSNCKTRLNKIDFNLIRICDLCRHYLWSSTTCPDSVIQVLSHYSREEGTKWLKNTYCTFLLNEV